MPGTLADPPPSLTQLYQPGYTKTVRPLEAYTEDLKRRQLAEFGYADRNPADYEEDHLVPLALVGAPQDERNLWPQPWADARVKDREENDLHIAVCQHRMAWPTPRRRCWPTGGHASQPVVVSRGRPD